MGDNSPPAPLTAEPAASYSLLYLVSYKWWRLYHYYYSGAIYEPEHVVTLSRKPSEDPPARWNITLDDRQPERYDYVLVWPSQWEWFCIWFGRPLCETAGVTLPLHYRGKIDDDSPPWLALNPYREKEEPGADPVANLGQYDRVHVVDNSHIIRSMEQQRFRCDGRVPEGVHLQAFLYEGLGDGSLAGEENPENPNPNPNPNPSAGPLSIRGFRGLVNDNGTSCYMNAVVQCLLHVPEFVRGLAEDVNMDTCTPGVATEFKNFLGEYFREGAGFESCFVSSGLKEAIYERFPNFRNGQQDVCEFWESLIRRLHLEIEDFNMIYGLGSAQGTTFVEDLFVDTLVQSAECPRCRSRAPTLQEPAPLITLPHVTAGGAAEIDLLTLVDAFFARRSEDRTSASSSARCDGCGESFRGGTRTALRLRPEFLIFLVPRNVSGGGVDNTPVRFPLRGLDMRPHAYDPDAVATYDLYAVVNRLGAGVEQGHYTADVALPEEGCWIRCDDQEIGRITEEWLDVRQAYLIFYRKRREAPADEQRVGEC